MARILRTNSEQPRDFSSVSCWLLCCFLMKICEKKCHVCATLGLPYIQLFKSLRRTCNRVRSLCMKFGAPLFRLSRCAKNLRKKPCKLRRRGDIFAKTPRVLGKFSLFYREVVQTLGYSSPQHNPA